MERFKWQADWFEAVGCECEKRLEDFLVEDDDGSISLSMSKVIHYFERRFETIWGKPSMNEGTVNFYRWELLYYRMKALYDLEKDEWDEKYRRKENG